MTTEAKMFCTAMLTLVCIGALVETNGDVGIGWFIFGLILIW